MLNGLSAGFCVVLLLCLPFFAALVIAIFAVFKGRLSPSLVFGVRFFVATVMLITFLLSCCVIHGLTDAAVIEYHYCIMDWVGYWSVDRLSGLMILLSSFLFFAAFLCGHNRHGLLPTEVSYFISLLLLQTCVNGVFCASDILTFFVFFEFSLMPMFIMIGKFGGERRVYSAFKIVLFTFAGSILMPVIMAIIYNYCHTFDLESLKYIRLNYGIPEIAAEAIWFMLFCSFAVKVPMVPIHVWLPDAHVQAPTAGSVILAGVMLKMGLYGMIKILIPMMPVISANNSFAVNIFACLSVVYASFLAFSKKDMKQIIAYSSIAHMGVAVMGIFSFSEAGFNGAVMQMIAHGLVSAALFLCVDCLYRVFQTRDINHYCGLIKHMPCYGLVFIFFVMASIGVPGTANFVGEISIIIGLFERFRVASFVVVFGIVLATAYMLRLYSSLFTGEFYVTEGREALVHDLSFRDGLILMLLMICVIILGVYPNLLLGLMKDYSGPDSMVQSMLSLIR